MAVVRWILSALVSVIVLLLFLPIRVRVEYIDQWRGTAFVFGIIPVFSFPVVKKKTPPKETVTASPPSETATAKPKPSLKDEWKALYRQDGLSGVLAFFRQLLHLFTDTLSRVVRFITVRKLELGVRVGGEEADTLAVRYAQISASLATALSALPEAVRLRCSQVQVVPDFTLAETTVRLRVLFWVWPFGVIAHALRALFTFIAVWTGALKKPRADSTQHESLKK